jgi:VWFA-related protein
MSNLPKIVIEGAANWLCIAIFAVCFRGAALTAQDNSTSTAVETSQNDSTPTLHVYKSLLQVPVLVLRPNGDRIKKPISNTLFSVSLDSGPWFSATHVRPEGDDPIALSILLDVNGGGRSLMPRMAEAIASLAPDSLRSQDHVSLYALDCSLIDEANDVSADSSALRQATNGALSAWRNKGHPSETGDKDCKQKVHLWDALAKLTETLHKMPGRRVIVVVSDGNDAGSAITRDQLIEKAQGASVAIFGLKYSSGTTATYTENPLQSRGEYGISPDTVPVELEKDNPFRSLCELTGGTANLTNQGTLKPRLKTFAAMLRERYIVEFPRPLNGKPGWHAIAVRVDRGNYLVRSAGITFPLMNPAVLADPTTVPSNPSLAPSFGARSMEPGSSPQ